MNRAELDEHCRALDLSWPSTDAEVKLAYREQVAVWHPDRFNDPKRKQKAEEKLKRINNALAALQALLGSGLGDTCANCGELLDVGAQCHSCERRKRELEEVKRRAAAQANRDAEAANARAKREADAAVAQANRDAEAAAARARREADAAVAQARREADAAAAQAPSRHVPAPMRSPAPVYVPPPVPELRIAGTWRSGDGTETWHFEGQDPHFTFQIVSNNPFYSNTRIGYGRAVRNGFHLQVSGVLTPMQPLAPLLGPFAMIEQPFFLPLQWDGTMLRGFFQNGLITNFVGLLPIA